jgi:predicted AlkP superfamily pyrophosphatase or phosphodiesterase
MSCTTTITAASRLLLLSVLQALVALLFLKGFLLTRVELPDVAQGVGSSSSSSSAQQPPPYQKAVVLIVDAVRYDFLCGTQPDLSGSLMPKTLRLVQAGVRVCCSPVRQAERNCC